MIPPFVLTDFLLHFPKCSPGDGDKISFPSPDPCLANLPSQKELIQI